MPDDHEDAAPIEQQAVGVDNVKGGGEWPDPDAPAEAPAPGSDPVEGEAIAEERKVNVDTSEPLKTVLEADPVRGGSKSTPD